MHTSIYINFFKFLERYSVLIERLNFILTTLRCLCSCKLLVCGLQRRKYKLQSFILSKCCFDSDSSDAILD